MRIIHYFISSRTFNSGITVTVQANVYSAQHISEIRGVCAHVIRWTDFRHACTNKRPIYHRKSTSAAVRVPDTGINARRHGESLI